MSPLFADVIITSTTTTNWENETYILNSDITISDRITVKRTATLVLNTGYTLTLQKGIYIDPDGTLIINGDGNLVTTGESQNAGITVRGTLEINGGNITSTGGNDAAGIGGDHYGWSNTVIINGGNITATGKTGGAGIGGGSGYNWSGAYGGCGTVIINGGIVRATGSDIGAGIGGGRGNNGNESCAGGGYDLIEINGGQVYAKSPYGYAIGPGSVFGLPGVLKIGWTNIKDDYLEIDSSYGIKFSQLEFVNGKEFRYSDTGVDGCTAVVVTPDNIAKGKIVPLENYEVLFFTGSSLYSNPDINKTFYGAKLKEPDEPQFTNCTFYGWYTDKDFTGNIWNFDTDLLTQSISLYSKFVASGIHVSLKNYFDIVANQVNISPRVTALEQANWVLKEGRDYTVSYADSNGNSIAAITQPGKYDVVITGINDYACKNKTKHIKVIQNLNGSGTAQDSYLINDNSDWELFANNISDDCGGYGYKDSYVKLMNDLEISMSAGIQDYPFSGILDCNVYAITFDNNGANPPEYIFNAIEDAVIKNLITNFETISGNSSGRNSIQNAQQVSVAMQTGINKKVISAGGTEFYCGGMQVSNIKSLYPLGTEPVKVEPVITINNKKLTAGTDYTVAYKNAVTGTAVTSITSIGEYTVTFTGINNYCGQVSYNFKVPMDNNGVLSSDIDGNWYVKLPADSSVTSLDLSNFENGFSFKIYDDGGQGGSYFSEALGNYSKNASGWLLITVPQDYLIQLEGFVGTKSKYEYLTVYDGPDIDDDTLYLKVYGNNLEDDYKVTLAAKNSSTNKILIYFNGSASTCEGFELTATIVNKKQVKATEDKTAPGVYYTTWYTEEGNFLADSNAQVFYVQKAQDGKVILKAARNNFIKKGQGVIIKSSSPDIILYETGQPADGYTYNSLLKGTTTLLESTKNLQGTVYAVSVSEKGGVGFYKWEGEIPANKAYLLIEGGEE